MLWFIINNIKENKKILLYSGGCILLSLLFLYFARSAEGFAEWYATSLYPLFLNTFGRLFSFVPFSVFEIVLGSTLLMFGYLLLKALLLIIIKSPYRKAFLIKSFRRSLCFLSSLLLLFVLTGSINYSRTAFAETANIAIEQSSKENLTRLCLMLIEDLSAISPKILTNEDSTLAFNQNDIGIEAITAMKNIGNQYRTLSGYYPNPKPIFLSDVMSSLGIAGIYSPFTIEANYNENIPPYMIPYTICHELAHLKGFMKEDEANFIAYLACRDSSSPVFQYSGAVNALSYSLNALYKSTDSENFAAVYSLIPDQIKEELKYNQNYWEKHTSTVSSIAESINNQYLKANDQVDGNNSYGKMVDLLLSEYIHTIKGEMLL
ncbi:MAG: DUF3810 domain-containing protein [Anaerovoracaceae bacterium]|jgi:hypothetical protein